MRTNGIVRLYLIDKSFFESDILPFKNGDVFPKSEIDFAKVTDEYMLDLVQLASLNREISKTSGQNIEKYTLSYSVEDYTNSSIINHDDDIYLYEITSDADNLHQVNGYTSPKPTVKITDKISDKGSGQTCSTISVSGFNVL